ncbi:MAG: hypothetical protein RLZ62_65 [Bacteroidota bacterium]|jgi:DNA recombination protein RmuC
MDADFLLLLAGFLAIVLVLLLLRKQGNQSPDSGGLVSRDLLEALQGQLEALKRELSAKEDDLRKTHAQLAARDQHILHLQESLGSLKSETEQLQKRFQTEFENVANRLLEEKSNRFTEQNARNLTNILTPLREKIKDLEDNIDRKFSEESREKTSLREELKQLQLLNSQLSSEAHNLVSALKGQSKTQGDWGELQLETILEKSGLQKGVHFETQASMRDEAGNMKRPDFIIHLPDNKHLIVDSKVSLSAFEQYFNSTEPQARDKFLSDHIRSLRKHIADLSATNYQLLGPVNSPDYLILFIPLDGALTAAVQADPRLYTEALERNIVLVSTSTLLATLRMVAYLWRQDKQTRSVQEIARQSGMLYDKFVAFVDDLRRVGTQLDSAKSAYGEAMNKLTDAARPGDTLIGKANKIRDLGAKTTKSLPPELSEE